ncbi:MAG: OstA-like protein [Haliscomenobacter sp.]|uniref:OstA-like protein n=1 Tax=Haliscomenobacter sp. TaxID=2717303 RepID=UPI0029BB72C8|nr:OstA-like protein [Haliscomenobacter sp.]MDX2070470.1 OstA-like protein [Haliscomenobacter sp.]
MYRQLWLLGLMWMLTGIAQIQAQTPGASREGSRVKILYSDKSVYETRGETTINRLKGKVELKQDSVYMYCDSAIVENETQVYAYGNVVIQQGDSLKIFADEAQYDGESKIANLLGRVILINGNRKLYTRRLDYRTDTRVAYYTNNATMVSDSLSLKSKVGYYYVATKQAQFRENVTAVGPRFSLKADSLNYNTESKVVDFLGPTVISNDSSKVYCEDGFYDTFNNRAEFSGNAQYVKKDQQAEADTITYDDNLKIYSLRGNARVEDSTRLAIGNLIRYDELQDTTFLQGNARYREKEQDINSEVISYNRKKGTFKTLGRTYVSDPPNLMEADQMGFDDATGLGVATGNVMWRDTAADLSINAMRADYGKKNGYLKASGGSKGRPELITIVEGDSLFLSADTLLAVKADSLPGKGKDSLSLGKNDSLAVVQKDTMQSDTSRILHAFHNARIYKKDFQAVCDSMVYSTRDSLFTLYGNPIVWSDTSQFTADTIYLTLKNKKLDKIIMRSNSFIVVISDGTYFNQIKARNVVSHFVESNLKRMDAFGNAEVIYYAKDDSGAYVGVNKTECSEMVIRFGAQNAVEKITFITDPKSVLSPMGTTNHRTLRLKGFRWEVDSRPCKREDIFVVLSPQSRIAPANRIKINSDEEKQ